jgi:RHS repeat-associated protein
VKNISYVYSNQDVIKESESVGSSVKEYVYWNEVDDLVASIEGTNMMYYEKNHLWSIVNVSDSSWSTITEYVYDVYGNVKSGDMSISTRLFTGREYDEETWLYFNRARYYSPTLWRFISRDPIDIQDDVNLYSYTANNPVNAVDRIGTEKSLLSKIWWVFVNFLWHEAWYIGAWIYNTTDFFGSNDYLTWGYSWVINNVKKCDSQATWFSAWYVCWWQREQDAQIMLDAASVMIGGVWGIKWVGMIWKWTKLEEWFETMYRFKKVYWKAKPWYSWHHIVEQNKANIEKFWAKAIHNIKNLVQIPEWKWSLHRQITGYYNSLEDFWEWSLKVRKFIGNFSFQEQYDFWLKVMRNFWWWKFIK